MCSHDKDTMHDSLGYGECKVASFMLLYLLKCLVQGFMSVKCSCIHGAVCIRVCIWDVQEFNWLALHLTIALLQLSTLEVPNRFVHTRDVYAIPAISEFLNVCVPPV